MSKLPYYIYRVTRVFYLLRIFPIAYALMLLNRIIFGLYLPGEARLGRGVRFGYGGSGVVIHKDAVIGDNVVIGPGVVIGGKSGIAQVPVIGHGCFLAAGSKILGPVMLGNNVTVGVNSVVLQSFDDGAVVAGIPARELN